VAERRSIYRGNVLALGLVSLLTDASSEMILPLLPLFLTTVLHAGATGLGGIEGAAEATAAILKLVSGRWADRTGRRRPFVLLGYGISTVSRPIVALATAPWHVLAVRMSDRVGKGIRTSPRDALISLSIPADQRGAAFGFHRAMDHAGAIVGPALAIAVLALFPGQLRLVFGLAALPGVLAVLAIAFLVRETEGAPPKPPLRLGFPSRRLRTLLVPLGLFSLGNASDAFLLLAVADAQRSPLELPALWMAFHVVKVAVSLAGGGLSDRMPRRWLISAGWLVYALVYAGFAFAHGPLAQGALFLVYGAYHGLTEGAEKAMVADLSAEEERGAAFGWYALTTGLLALPASLGFGILWDAFGPRVPFLAGACLALSAVVALQATTRDIQRQKGG
jgi:MFS family permease